MNKQWLFLERVEIWWGWDRDIKGVFLPSLLYKSVCLHLCKIQDYKLKKKDKNKPAND